MTNIPQNYVETAPSRHMLRWVEQGWRFTAIQSGSAIILPDARSDIMFRYRKVSDELSVVKPIFTAPAIEPFTVEFEAGDCWLGVRLRPEHTASLCGLSPRLLRDGALRAHSAERLLNKLGVNHSKLCKELMLEPALQTALHNLPDVQLVQWLKPAVDRFHLTGGRATISKTATSLGISVRQLHRGFLKYIGVGPKDYCGVIRFHRALRLLRYSHIRIADAAFETGYADQSHMTRDFMRFGGFTPSNIPENLSLPGLPI